MGRDPWGCAEFRGVPSTLPLLSTMCSPQGVRPCTARDMTSDYYWLWRQVTEGMAGTSLIPQDLEERGRPLGFGPPGVGPGRPLRPRTVRSSATNTSPLSRVAQW